MREIVNIFFTTAAVPNVFCAHLATKSGSSLVGAVECAPGGGQIERLDLTVLAGLLEDGSHDEAPIPQRGVQAAGR